MCLFCGRAIFRINPRLSAKVRRNRHASEANAVSEASLSMFGCVGGKGSITFRVWSLWGLNSSKGLYRGVEREVFVVIKGMLGV